MVARGVASRRSRGGTGFAWLWSAAAISTLGDGVYATALPLLAFSLSRDPVAIALVASSPYVSWALFGLISGVLVDRYRRPRLMVSSDLWRGTVLGVAVGVLLLDQMTIPILVVTGVLLGAAQTLFDTASQAHVPTIVGTTGGALERANSRLVAVQTVNTEFMGPPLGAALFSVVAGLAFVVNTVSFLISALLLIPLLRRGPAAPPRPASRPSRPWQALSTEIVAGLRFLLAHRLLRTLTLVTALVNLGWMAGESVLVLLARERLGLGAIGFGLLVVPQAVGGLIGAVVAPLLATRLGTGKAALCAVVALSAALTVLGLAASPWLAGGALVICGLAIAVYNVLGQSLRQAVTPDELLGRVVSAFRMVALGCVPIGALLGGLVGRVDLRATYLAGAALLLATVMVTAPALVRARTGVTAG